MNNQHPAPLKPFTEWLQAVKAFYPHAQFSKDDSGRWAACHNGTFIAGYDPVAGTCWWDDGWMGEYDADLNRIEKDE